MPTAGSCGVLDSQDCRKHLLLLVPQMLRDAPFRNIPTLQCCGHDTEASCVPHLMYGAHAT